jgi:hypothetical protein
MNAWLKRYEPLAVWLQGIGVVFALLFGGFQIREARHAFDASMRANEIALRTRLSDVLMRINEISLEHPELPSGYTSLQRLQLIRIEYLFQAFNMHEEGFLSDARFEAESEYLKWSAGQPDFLETWRSVQDQYPSSFSGWMNSSTETLVPPATVAPVEPDPESPAAE